MKDQEYSPLIRGYYKAIDNAEDVEKRHLLTVSLVDYLQGENKKLTRKLKDTTEKLEKIVSGLKNISTWE